MFTKTLSKRSFWLRLGLVAAILVLLAGLALPQALAWNGLRTARADLAAYHPEAAARALAPCLSAWPSSATVHLLASRAARQRGDMEEAARELRACQRLEGGSTDAVAFEWALLQAAGGNVREVEDYLQGKVDWVPESGPLVWEALAEGYLRVYRNSDAKTCVDVWLEREPNNARALELRGRTFVAGRGVVRGAEALRRSLELDPDRPQTRWRFIECLINLGAYDEAAGHLETVARERPDDPQVAARLARCYNMLNRRDEARQLLARALALHPDDGPCLRVRGQIALSDPRDPEADRAEEWFRRAAEQFPNDYQTQWLLFEAYRRQEKDAEANAQLKTAEAVKARSERITELSSRRLGEQPLDPAIHYEMGLLMIGTGRGEAGERWLLSALTLDPDHQPSHAALADYYDRTGQPDKAAEHRGRAKAK